MQKENTQTNMWASTKKWYMEVLHKSRVDGSAQRARYYLTN
jgi:hypothetical protein